MVLPRRLAKEEDGRQALLGEPAIRSQASPTSSRAELGNILLLLFLYVLQGIPLGLAGSIPLILQSKNVSYKDQAFFSFVFWPFSLKLFWAPLVDAVYFKRFGRRKSWLVPTQYTLGLFMIYLSRQVDSLLGEADGKSPDVVALTVTFFLFEFLAATQDIAVDGWALTMLSRENVGYASTCNSVGQTAGYFLGNVLFLALESASFCNKYLRFQPQPKGIVTLSDFLFFWGAVFLITTTLVALLKKENKKITPLKEETNGITDTYKLLFSIVRMPAVLTFCALILTAKIGFSAADAVTGLKLVEEGVPKEHLALLAVPMVPLQIILPLIISKYTAGPKPLNTFYKAMPFRLLFGLEFAFLVWWTPKVKYEGGFPIYYYIILLLSYALHQVTVYSMYVAVMAFNAKVSDPLIGGTYMTLLNTVSNLGGNWPATVALWLVDPLTPAALRPGAERGRRQGTTTKEKPGRTGDRGAAFEGAAAAAAAMAGERGEGSPNYIARLSEWADAHLTLVRNISTGMAIAGVILLARSIRLTTKFTNALEIPLEFVEKNVKLRGRLQQVTEQGLEIEHVPITLPVVSSLQRRRHSDGLLQIRLAGVELTPDGTLWLKEAVKPSQTMWFQILGRKNSVLHCLVVVNKGRFSSVCLNEEILRQGLGRTVNIEGLVHESPLYWKLHKRLLQAELKAVKKNRGIWKETTFIDKLKDHISSNKYLQNLRQFATWLRMRL
ncbi:hypothetical protein JRQ81_017675 [Phrynocephalus forsythii]|uniref:Acetyl-coenzyme A transporter 1 n=1 Tax=Phrynocephalus forsythii TaxID=171643 RepID=A0A9Q1B0Q8_9SAUR|nr:hypothetical protein JRQ81_017675 [Phrynocephalus forsythii]